MSDVNYETNVKREILQKLENGESPSKLVDEILMDKNLSRGSKMKIIRHLELKGADKNIRVNNPQSLAYGIKNKSIRKSRKSRRYKKSRKSRKSRK